MTGGSEAISAILSGLLDRDEVLGVVAASPEGLVLGVAGVPEDEAASLAALGASLAGVAQRTISRLGGGAPELLTISSADGAIHVRGGTNIALIVVTDRRGASALSTACTEAMDQLSSLLVFA